MSADPAPQNARLNLLAESAVREANADENWPSATQNWPALAAATSEGWRGASNVATLAGAMIGQRVLQKLAQLAGSGVPLDLKIPLLSVPLQQPVAKLRNLFGRQLLDLFLKRLNSGHNDVLF